MSGLFSTLNASVKALSAQSRALEVTGKNLANVNNPSYARQRVIFGDRGTVETPEGAESLGLEALGIQQLRDGLLDKQVMREIALTASTTAEQQTYQRTQASLGQAVGGTTEANGVGGGLGGAIDDFFNAFQSFASRPTDDGEKQTLLQRASILTDRFQQTDSRLGQVQSDIDTQIAGDVADANRLLASIADLNKQIGRIETGRPGIAIDLRDQREARLEELAAKIPVQTRTGANGMINVVMKDASNADVLLVDGLTVTGPFAFTGTTFTGGASATVLVTPTGSVAGFLNARDGTVQTLRDQLDLLAEQMVTAVNSAYNPTNAAGFNFFDPAGLTASAIGTDAALTASSIRAGIGGAGENSLALAVAALASQVFSTGSGNVINGTLNRFYVSAASDLGQALATVNAQLDDQAGIEKLVRTQRDSVSGVSLDEEMAELVRYQRAFQASSRVFGIIDGLLDIVVNRLGTF
jgi:flagellar hook-associated protein 1 FlgK